MYFIGNLSIYLGFSLSILALFCFIVGIFKKNQKLIRVGKIAIFSVFISALTSIITMEYLLVTSQFKFKYVASYTNFNLPLIYKVTALWAGKSGSLLFWGFILALFVMIITFSKKTKNSQLTPYAVIIILLNFIFFFLIIIFFDRPFAILDSVQLDGKGLNPMLQNLGMILHPFTLYLGYIGLVVPFAYAIAQLVLKKADFTWISLIRRWTITSWLFLTIGNLIGGYWAYTELGWGGYWAWDPVENASLMPWLTVTAFIHSAIVQERKNKFKIWNVILIIISYSLTLFGAFLVRGGFLNSVHAFGKSNLGIYFLTFMAMMIVISIYLLMSRSNILRSDTTKIDSYLSKEGSFYINNIILVGATFVVLLGTISPQISQLFMGSKISLGISFYNTVLAPVFLGLLVLLAICPLLNWNSTSNINFKTSLFIPAIISVVVVIIIYLMGIRALYPVLSFFIVTFMISIHFIDFHTSIKPKSKIETENYYRGLRKPITKNHFNYGGFIVHIGIALIAIGIIGSSNYGLEKVVSLGTGERIVIKDYSILYDDITVTELGEKYVFSAKIRVEKNGNFITNLQPKKTYYSDTKTMYSIIAIKSTLKEDLYIVLNSWESDKSATFLVKVNPLIIWIWIGGIFILIGTLIAIWRRKSPMYTSF